MIYLKYKVYCNVDAKWEEWILPEGTVEPTTCPVDSTHAIDSTKTSIVETIDTSVGKVEVQKTVDPAPFAQPTFRTKWDASPDVASCIESQNTIMDYVLTEEKYVHGGSLVFEGIQIGDWFEAMVVDPNGVIPEPYRAAVSEAYPVINKYIIKQYLPAGDGQFSINTYPLNAKITPGLVLRVIIHTCSDPGTRKIATNYLITKKLA